MLTQTINRSDAEVIFGTFQNVEGASLPVDAVVQLDISTDINGNRVVQPNTNELNAVIGLLRQSLADDDFGLVQVYGYRATSLVFQTNTSQAAGLKMGPTAGANHLASIAAGDGRDGFFVLCESIASSSASTAISARVHIRCL